MANETTYAPTRRIEDLISLVRGQRVMLDSDLANVYVVTTTRLNEQFRRNLDRFPDDFAFQLTAPEFARLISQFAISKKGRGGRSLPEHRKQIGFMRETAPPYRVNGRQRN